MLFFRMITTALAAWMASACLIYGEDTPIRIACVGDSITAGARLNIPTLEAYPAQLKRMLGEKWEVQNFGASGTTLMNLEGPAYQKSGQFQYALAYKPNIVILMLGTNDTKPENWKSKERFSADYKDLIRKFKALGSSPRIFLCRPPTIYSSTVSGINEPSLLEQLPLIDTIAKEENLELIDIHGATSGQSVLFGDGVHPNVAGANTIARAVFKHLTGQEFTGEMPLEIKSTWRGYRRLDFAVDGRGCILIFPTTPAPGNPWIWRTEFFGAWPQADVALLAKGYHVAYMDVQNMYGAPVALDHMDQFYDFLRKKYQLSAKVVLEGFSRGGLFAFNWAARHPDQVASLYVDAPVCDFKSWPGGKGHGKGSPGDWAACKRVYSLTEEQAVAYPLNPIDNLKPLAEAKIPILSVCGAADDVVPFDENTALIEKRYRELGGEIKVILKPGIGHHPHSLEDPTPIIDFILTHQAIR